MDPAALREVLGHAGPFASVHLDARYTTEDAAKLLGLRWRAARSELTEQSTPESTLTALDDAIDATRPPVGHAGRLLVAAGDTVLVDTYLPAPPARPHARLSRLPYLLPLATWDSAAVPHVVVVVDRTGADLRAVDATGMVRAMDRLTGVEHPVHKIRGGGWSHRNIQQHADETARHNVHEVADAAASLVGDVDARLLILAGDSQSRRQLHDMLPVRCKEIATEVEHARATQVSHSTIEETISALLAEYRQAEWDHVLARFRAECDSPDGLAVHGLPATAAALREANVSMLLANPDTLARTTVWTGGQLAMVATGPGELPPEYGSHRQAPSDEALPAAAIVTGAEILASAEGDTRSELPDGVGALLRHG